VNDANSPASTRNTRAVARHEFFRRALLLGVGAGDRPGNASGELNGGHRGDHVGRCARRASALDQTFNGDDRSLADADHFDRRAHFLRLDQLRHRNSRDHRVQRFGQVFVLAACITNADRRTAVRFAEFGGRNAAQPAGERVGHSRNRQATLSDAPALERDFHDRLHPFLGLAHIGERRQPLHQCAS
jgi:hypothetical protein